MDSVVCVTSIRDCFTLINVFAGDAVSTVAKWTLATFEGAVGEADAFCPREAWVGETSICTKELVFKMVFYAGK